MGVKLGLDAKLYFDEEGAAHADWTELTNVKDVTLDLSKTEADVTTRASAGWRLIKGALKEAVVDFDMVWDTDDDGFTALQTAFFDNTAIGIAIMDGDVDTEGSEGLVADFDVLKFTRNEELAEAIKVSVTVKPTYSATAPSWLTVAAS